MENKTLTNDEAANIANVLLADGTVQLVET